MKALDDKRIPAVGIRSHVVNLCLKCTSRVLWIQCICLRTVITDYISVHYDCRQLYNNFCPSNYDVFGNPSGGWLSNRLFRLNQTSFTCIAASLMTFIFKLSTWFPRVSLRELGSPVVNGNGHGFLLTHTCTVPSALMRVCVLVVCENTGRTCSAGTLGAQPPNISACLIMLLSRRATGAQCWEHCIVVTCIICTFPRMNSCWHVSGWQDWPGDVGIHSGTAVQEDDDTNDCCWDQHLSVYTQPGKVQTNFLAKIFPVCEREREKAKQTDQ